jgi:hypothetical protein
MLFNEGETQMPNYKNDPVVSVADNTNVPAVQGVSGTLKGIGVEGRSTYQPGVHGVSAVSNGILGETTTGIDQGGAGVAGVCDEGLGNGIYGRSQNRHGVIGYSQTTELGQGAGVWGESAGSSGVRGVSHAPGQGGVVGVSVNATGQAGPGVYGVGPNVGVLGEGIGTNGIGVLGKGPRAGRFEGDVEVTGDIRLTNADCAEDFDIVPPASGYPESVAPGTVMVLANEGALRASHQAYDRRVAGIISGAGDYQPALVLDRQSTGGNRQPIALMGKVFCKVDAQYGAVEIGDLLTTSPTPGHAMKAADPLKAFGAVLGKALRPLDEGQGLIPVLVSLQ